MLPPVKFTVRVFWQKLGNASYISHLDTQRTVTRALIRSGLPVYYSQGFNPHPRLVFALPVSIYQEAYYDIFDFDISEMLPVSKIKEALSAAMPKDMPIIDVAYPQRKLKELCFASYRISLETDSSAEEIRAAFDGAVVVEKKSKTKCENVDISPMIKQLSTEKNDGGIDILAVLSAAPDNYLNPKYLTEHISDRITFSKTVRTMLYDKKMQPLK